MRQISLLKKNIRLTAKKHLAIFELPAKKQAQNPDPCFFLKTEEWIKKMWHVYTMEYYSAIKRNEIGSFVETWMDLESVTQSEVSQKEKQGFPGGAVVKNLPANAGDRSSSPGPGTKIPHAVWCS